MKKSPLKLDIRMYQVGFGDCFLLSFQYSSERKDDRHILIDFGTTAQPDKLMLDIAKHIEAVVDGKLHAVIATHRHRDHISGFATKPGKSGSGDVIASMKPDLVIQPWTEDPNASPNAKIPTQNLTSDQAFLRGLAGMNELAGIIHQIATHASALRKLEGSRETPTLKQLAFLGENNLANISAVKNLQSMGRKNEYIYYGSKTGLSKILPGVKIKVLGPPTLKQSDKISKQRSKDAAEFWHLQAAASKQFASGSKSPFGRKYEATVPPAARWLTRRLDRIVAQQMLGIVRSLDDQMNNTSLIFLMQIGNQTFLFPGDAQIENWSYALFHAPDHQDNQKLLADVDLYKVGHHGSLNATPKSLWNLFKHRATSIKSKSRLTSMMSTQVGVHGHAQGNTEVPRSKLVDALGVETNLISTAKKKKTRLEFEEPKIQSFTF